MVEIGGLWLEGFELLRFKGQLLRASFVGFQEVTHFIGSGVEVRKWVHSDIYLRFKKPKGSKYHYGIYL